MNKAEASMANFGKSAARVGAAANDLGRSTAGVMQRQAQLGFQLQDLAVQIQGGQNPFTALLQQGSQVQAVYSGQGGFMQAFRDLGSMATGLVTKLWPVALAVGGITAGLGLMTSEINKGKGATVGFGDVALATWQVISGGVYSIVQPAIAAIGGFFADLWGTISPYIVTAVNGIIGGFVGAFEAIKATWSALPSALGDIMITTANVVIKGVEAMVNKVGELINGFLAPYNAGLASMGQATLPTVGTVNFGGFSNPFAGQLGDVAGNASSVFAGAQGNYLGDFMSAVGDKARANMAAAKEEIDGVGGSAKAANDNLKDMAGGGLKELADVGQQVSSTLSSGFSDMFKGLLRGTTNVMDAIGQLLNKLADLFIDQAFNMLFSSFGGGGGFLSNLFGGMPSFAGGGFTGVGARAGGLDGKGGFLAMMHPNETVFDHTNMSQRSGGGAIAVDVRMGVENGNLVPLITNVSGQVAGQQIKQNNKQLPGLLRDVNQRYG
jgi:hypothetical protein